MEFYDQYVKYDKYEQISDSQNYFHFHKIEDKVKWLNRE